jgi:sterol desaturase/sphingolipid hydroxylase (fatty acid hydroxylase superfamily)
MDTFSLIVLDHMIIHWSLVCILSVIDLYLLINDCWDTYKLSDRAYPEKPLDIIYQILFNQFFVLIPIIYLFSDLFSVEGGLFEYSNIYKIPISLLCIDFLFYYSHVLFHSTWLSKYHSIHHQWNGSFVISTFHCSPYEMAFVNIFPLIFSGLFAGLNFRTMRLLHILSLQNTMIVAHGGYKCFGEGFHELHHKYRNCNYGIFGFLDKFHGTYMQPVDPN